MGRRIGIGLIGCGSLAQRGILPHLALDDAQSLFDLVAVCDVVGARAQATAEQFGVPRWYVSAEELAADADIEAVLVVTPIPYHYANAMAAVNAGKHVYVQKTMTTSLSQADVLVAAAQARGVKLVASPGQMLSPAYQQLKALISQGHVGKVYWAFGSTSFPGHEYEAIRNTQPVDPTWYYKPGGGPLYDMGVYVLHALTGMLGPVRQVTCMSSIGLPERSWGAQRIPVEMDDNTLLLLDFGNGTLGVVGAQFCHFGRVLGWSFMGVYGSAGTFEISAMQPGTGYPGRIEFQGQPELNDVFGFPQGVLTATAMPASGTAFAGGHAELPEVHVWADIRHFGECILNHTEPLASGEHARHVIEIIEKGYAAARTGQTLELTTRF